MISWIVLAQAAIYLLIMPVLRASGEFGYHPPVGVGLVAVIAFAIGAFVKLSNTPGTLPQARRVTRSASAAVDGDPCIKCRIRRPFARFRLAEPSAGLRSDGGDLRDYAALGACGHPRLRVDTDPTLILYLIAKPVRRLDRLAIIVSILTSLPFMGISDSRGRVVVIALTVMAFFPLGKVARYVHK